MKNLLYFSPVPWASYKQRPHFFIEHFLRKDYQVLWVEPYPVRLPNWSDLFRSAKIHNQGTPLPNNLSLIKLPALPIEPLPGLNLINKLWLNKSINVLRSYLEQGAVLGIGKPCLIALDLLKQYPDASFYDAMDDFPEFHHGIARWHLEKVENQIAERVKTVLVSSTPLEQKFNLKNKKVIKILNGLDASVLPALESNNKTANIIGYIGSIAKWFDWDIVLDIAQAFPNLTIQLIGPCFVECDKKIPTNIQLVGAIPHSQIGNYLIQFKISLIPFTQTNLTHGVDPIKYYEYRAMNLPVLSTCFGEMKYRQNVPGVFIINKDNVITQIQKALQYESPLEFVQEFRHANAWQHRLQQLQLLSFI